MAPPGLPDWPTRRRLVATGSVPIAGRAWSGGGRTIAKVEFGVDDDWHEATLAGQVGRYAWTKWQAVWQARPGDHILRCRATDSDGHAQPFDPPRDVGGFGNNAVQEVTVHVTAPA